MSEFRIGDRVVIAQITDVESDEPGTVYKTNDELRSAGYDTGIEPGIGSRGTIVEIWDEGPYYVGILPDKDFGDSVFSYVKEDIVFASVYGMQGPKFVTS